ncbi:MAG: hypothetical protein J0H31_06365 [Alphaproteobacteria bacterium]|nr:hypothetical protein [Alphaproteobacteria bacterium]
MTRAQAEAVVKALNDHLNTQAAAAYSKDDRGRQTQARDAYEKLIEELQKL